MLDTGASTGSDDNQKEDIMDEIEFATFSTMSEEQRTRKRRLVKEIALLCFIYEMDFRNLAEEKNLGVGEDLSVRWNLFRPILYTTYKWITWMIMWIMMCSVGTTLRIWLMLWEM